jgi:hypothetical protein
MPIGGVAVLLATPALFAAFGWRGVWTMAVAMFAALVMASSRPCRARFTGMQAGTSRSLASIRAALAQSVPWLLGPWCSPPTRCSSTPS